MFDVRQHRGQGDRALWAAVVQQAIDDLDAPPDSLERADAVAFFTGRGEWRQSRIDIADRLGIHADDLERCGRRLMEERGITESVPARPVPRVVEPPVVVVALPSPVKPARKPKVAKDRTWWIRQFLTERAA